MASGIQTTGVSRDEALIAAVGRVVAAVSTFASFMVLVRALSQVQYAQLGLITGLQSFVHTVVVGPAITRAQREVWEWRQQATIARNCGHLVVAVTATQLVTNLAVVVVAAVLGWIGTREILGVALGAVVAAVASGLATVFLVGWILRERLAFATHAVLDGVSRVAAAVALSLLGVQEAWIYYLTMVLAGLFGAVVAYRLSRTRLGAHRITFGFLVRGCEGASLRNIVATLDASSLRLTKLLSWMLTTGNRYFLEPLVPRAALGGFLASWGLGMSLMSIVDGLYAAVILPGLYQNTSGKNDTAARRKLENSLYLAILLAALVPLTVVAVSAAEHLAAVVLNNVSVVTIQVLRAGVVFAGLFTLLGNMINVSLVERKPKDVATAMVTAFVVGISSLVALTNRASMAEGAWGLALGAAAGLAVAFMLLRRGVSFRLLMGQAGHVALGSVAVAGIAWLVFRIWTALELSAVWRVAGWGVVGTAWAAWLWLVMRPQIRRATQAAVLCLSHSPDGGSSIGPQVEPWDAIT